MLIQEQPLQVLPGLAVAIGLNEAMFLQQVHYWITSHGKEKEGYVWTYNSYKDWHKQFPFWTERTIKTIVLRLEKLGYLVSGNFNKKGFDRTKWYRIDYEKINELAMGKSFPHGGTHFSQPIPENISEIKKEVSKDTSKERKLSLAYQFKEFMETFNERLGSKYQVTSGRREKYRLRRKTYSQEDLLQALENMVADKFYLGENDRGWRANPDFFLRSDEKVDEFLNKKQKAGMLSKLKDWREVAKERGLPV